MIHSTTTKLIVLALCITHSFCLGQQNRSAICRLGEISNDSILPFVESLEIDCSKDIKVLVKKIERLSTLKKLELKGDASSKDWASLFEKLKVKPSVKTIVFNENTFISLPYGYEGLYLAENISFQNNDEIDYTLLAEQLATLPNLKELSIELVTIFELPKKLDLLKNVSVLKIINTDEAISKTEVSLVNIEKDPITYDYSLKNEIGNPVAIKYTALAGEIDSDEYKELSKRFSTTNNFEEASTRFVPKYKNVDPPLKGIDVDRKTYVINPQIENTLSYPSGTKILIPSNTFVDKTGAAINSSVTISYREFSDPVDFLVSGIPMKYDTAGEVTNFESAGMFELLASKGNEALTVAKDKNIEMNFVTTSKDSTYNFYSFNDTTGNWSYLNKPQTVTTKTRIPYKSPTRAYTEYIYANSGRARVYDSTTFDSRFNSIDHMFTHRKDAPQGQGVKYYQNGKTRHKIFSRLVRINNVKRTREGDVLFRVSYIPNAHPEMSRFNNTYFAVSENISAHDFRQKFARRKYYSDIRIEANGEDLEIKLKDNTSVKSISASLVTLDKKGKVKKVNNFNSRIKHYNRNLKYRERLFNKALKKGKLDDNQIVLTDPKEISLYAFQCAKKLMTDDEKKMTLVEWENYCEQTKNEQIEWRKKENSEKIALLANAEATAPNLIQSLSLSGTGIYNCDQIQRLVQPVEIFASYKTADNEKIKPRSAYILDKSKNSVFQYDGHYGLSASKIAFSKSPTAENTLLAVNDDGSIAIYRTEDFKKTKFQNKEHFDFTVNKINSNFSTVSDLKALIGF